MNLLESVLLVVHLLVAAAICGFVLLQHGKGADMGAAFGSGSSGSLFGAAGSANFLSRTTAILAAVFFLSSLGLTYFGTSTTARAAGVDGVMRARARSSRPRRRHARCRRACRRRPATPAQRAGNGGRVTGDAAASASNGGRRLEVSEAEVPANVELIRRP